MVWRALQVRLVTTPDGMQVQRVTGREFLPWSTVRGFEVHDSTSGRILMVVARRTNSRTVRLRSFSATRADEAEAFRAALEADRLERANPAARAADALA